ncbi:MAG: (Fe-S)-binding protein [Deltaproteobacteria bacterium]|jgi:Fe-S oxidoreductase
MKRSKKLVSQALAILKDNLGRVGDPLGFKKPYWTEWADGLNLPAEGEQVLLTARMYQMLPYITQITALVTTAKPLLAIKGLDKAVIQGNRMAGETLIRLKARRLEELKRKGERILRGIAGALHKVDVHPAYLYEAEPYSGVLLYDLGLEDGIALHIKGVYELLRSRGVDSVITVDPHTTYMMREIYPKYIENYAIKVQHYFEVLCERADTLGKLATGQRPESFVIHDPCVMARDLGIVEQARKIGRALGIKIIEPENTKLDTACCGGPVEYAFAHLTHQISSIRVSELARLNSNVLVTCPICLINLRRHEKEGALRVWDMGEILPEQELAPLSS